jgi:hypothetical protein
MGMHLQSVLEPLLAKLCGTVSESFQEWSRSYQGAGLDERAIESERLRLEGELSSLVTRFRGYCTLDGGDLDPLPDQFAEQSDKWEQPAGSSVYCNVATAAGDVDDVAKLVHSEQWKGRAAMAFHNNFLVPFKNAAVVHGACAQEMAIGAKALAQAVQRAKECVVWICENATQQLRAGGGAPPPLPGQGAEGGVKQKAGFAAILSDSVAFFLALAGPEGDALDMALAAVGVSGGLIAESKSPPGEQSIYFEGTGVFDPGGLLGTIYVVERALVALDKNIAELDDKVARGLEKDVSPSGPFGSPAARMKDPGLRPSAHSELEFTGRDDINDAVVTSIARLFDAGYRTLPAASWSYDAGARICAAAHINGAQAQFPRAVGKFNEAAQTLRGLLSAVRDDLIESGESMVTAAKTYQYADAYEAAKIQQIETRIPAPGDLEGNQHYTPPAWLTP